MSGNSITNVLGGVATIVIVGLVVSNAKGVAGIINSIGNLYSSAARAATAGPHA
jgi:hypothetical protein